MRLLNVIRSLDPALGGPAEGLRQSVQATRALGHVEEVATLDDPADAWLRGFPATTHALGPAASFYGHTPALVPWLRERASDYDAVVVHGLWQYPGLGVWRALRHSPVPYFVYPHGMLDPWFKRTYPLKHLKKSIYWQAAERRVLRDAAAVLFTASEEQRLAAQSFWPYEVNPVVVGYGVALGEPETLGSAEAFLTAYPETRGKRLLLFLARLHPKKGGDLLIEAFAQIAPSAPDLHLVMAGPDDRSGVRAGLEALAHRLGVAERITWTGMLTGPDKWSALQAAEVFVLPSHQENFGIAVVEALAMGVPVLISERVNIWREITQAGAGFANSDSVAGTVASLERWLALDREPRRAMQRNAFVCYQRHFHMASAAQRLIDTVTAHTPSALPAPPRFGFDSQP